MYDSMWEVVDEVDNTPTAGPFHFRRIAQDCENFTSEFKASGHTVEQTRYLCRTCATSRLVFLLPFRNFSRVPSKIERNSVALVWTDDYRFRLLSLLPHRRIVHTVEGKPLNKRVEAQFLLAVYGEM